MKSFSLLLVLLWWFCLSPTSGAGMLKGNAARSNYLFDGKEENTVVVEYMEGVDFKSSAAPKVIVFYSPFCG